MSLSFLAFKLASGILGAFGASWWSGGAGGKNAGLAVIMGGVGGISLGDLMGDLFIRHAWRSERAPAFLDHSAAEMVILGLFCAAAGAIFYFAARWLKPSSGSDPA